MWDVFGYYFSLSQCRAACTIKCDVITCDIYHNTLVLVEKSGLLLEKLLREKNKKSCALTTKERS